MRVGLSSRDRHLGDEPCPGRRCWSDLNGPAAGPDGYHADRRAGTVANLTPRDDLKEGNGIRRRRPGAGYCCHRWHRRPSRDRVALGLMETTPIGFQRATDSSLRYGCCLRIGRAGCGFSNYEIRPPLFAGKPGWDLLATDAYHCGPKCSKTLRLAGSDGAAGDVLWWLERGRTPPAHLPGARWYANGHTCGGPREAPNPWWIRVSWRPRQESNLRHPV